MKQILVAVPSKFKLNETETAALKARIEKLAKKAEAFASEECHTIIDYCYYFSDKTFRECRYLDEGHITIDLIEHAVNALCECDFSVFPFDWETSRICRILHKVADECGVTPLEFKEDD